MTGTEQQLSPLVGPWGDEDCTTMMFPVCNAAGACVHSELDALTEYCGIVEDWTDYALSVEGPLMYHAIPGDYDERIEPCECADDHSGQVEVWRVVSQPQEPTARARERKRIADMLDEAEIGVPFDLTTTPWEKCNALICAVQADLARQVREAK